MRIKGRRVERELRTDAHPFAVTEIVVYPSARPDERRIVERNPETPDLVGQGEVRE